MQKVIFYFFFPVFGLLGIVDAQVNLVLNPSFENYTTCPSATGAEINKIVDWDTCRGSADYFNECGTISYIQVPNNYFGHQYPAHGSAYCGFYTYISSGFYRELMIGKLSSPMVISQKYFISLKVNRADSNLIVGYSTNKIGVKFSKFKLSYVAINNLAHFYNPSIITDTINWTKISGSFIADSAYTQIMIGNFFDDSNLSIFNHGNGTSAYYYIDEVCVSTDSLFTANYITGLNKHSYENTLSFFPNPSDEFIILNSLTEDEIKIYNCIGEEIFKVTEPMINKKINCSNWPQGLYFLETNSFRQKIIISH